MQDCHGDFNKYYLFTPGEANIHTSLIVYRSIFERGIVNEFNNVKKIRKSFTGSFNSLCFDSKVKSRLFITYFAKTKHKSLNIYSKQQLRIMCATFIVFSLPIYCQLLAGFAIALLLRSTKTLFRSLFQKLPVL